jgi:hypothetical protein
MSINSTSNAGNVIAELANQLFQRVDNDHDGKLNSDEFQSFLTTLISQVTNRSTNGLGTEASAGPRITSVPPNGYQAMVGFNFAKLNDLTHTTPKYVFARATQNIANMGYTRAARSTGLDAIVEDVRANGYPKATVTADDTIDFGDGFGNIDVLTSDGQWWWGPEGS